jgi:hypothetical protein
MSRLTHALRPTGWLDLAEFQRRTFLIRQAVVELGARAGGDDSGAA